MDATNEDKYGEIDEAEEEALLKSDDESNFDRVESTADVLAATTAEYIDEDELMSENAAQVMIAEACGDSRGSGGNIILDEDGDEDDDDDDDVTSEEKVLRDYTNLLKELETDKYAYDKYVRLCELAHATDDLDHIRHAYNLFAAVYPLSPELWLQYLNIEANVALSPSEVEKVVELFKTALKDYYSVDVALEYAALAPRTANPDGIWQEVLGTYGLHCMRGQEFFKLYRKFLASRDNKSAEWKLAAYVTSFVRELTIPLNNMEESYIEFKVYYEKHKTLITPELDWESIDSIYFKAKEHLQKILTYEQQLLSIDPKCYRERAEVYKNYIKQSDKFLDENVLQTVYERMVADCCLNVECWLTYIDFLEFRDEFERPEELQEWPLFQQDVTDVAKRALRNCSWSDQLYIKHMQLLERQGKPREEIQEVLETSMAAGFQMPEPAVAIWLEYLTYLRRNTNWENEDECEILRKNFNLAWTILGQQWGVLADCNCEILQFWGRLEYGPLRDAKRGKELWNTVMESSNNATKSGLWTEYAQLELRRDLEGTRKLYRKALYSTGLDNPPVIAAAWERFERCNGTINTLTVCIKDCKAFSLQYKSWAGAQHAIEGGQEKTKSNAIGKGTKRRTTSINEIPPEKKSKSDATEMRDKGKGKRVSESEAHPAHIEAAFKEHENQEIDLTKDQVRVFLSNLHYNLTEDDIRAGLPELKITKIDLIRSANGRSRGFGYLELESAAEVEKALGLDRRTLNGRPLYISSVLRDKEKRQKFKYSDNLEPQKLFVRGLPNDATQEELQNIFAGFGKLKDVRLVFHKSGKFKNIAYVEFDDAGAAGKAVLGTDQMEIRGHVISVAISAPPPKQNSPATNLTKRLPISTKRNKVFEQKPRMSLIPNVVRMKLAPATAAATITKASQTSNGTAASSKTNEDFRKLLQK